VKRAIAALALCLAVVMTGCTPTGQDETISVLGGHVLVHVPANHTHVGVVVLHSYAHSIDEPVAQGWNVVSEANKFVAIYPEHVPGSWNAGLCCGTAAAQHVDDVGWLSGVVAQMRARYGLTTIYLSGFSNGGMMVERLVAERPSLTTRIAVWGAAPEMPVAGSWSGYGAIYDGSLDQTVPWVGGVVTIGGTPTLIRSALTTGRWLVGAHLKGVVVPGYGHTPMSSWPNVAWKELSHG
jgi:poly(3-hydroxybutyrate) depolymerase